MRIITDKQFIIHTFDKKWLFKRYLGTKGNTFILRLDGVDGIEKVVERNITDDDLATVLFSMITEAQGGEFYDDEGRVI
jgi:hypothetical protein